MEDEAGKLPLLQRKLHCFSLPRRLLKRKSGKEVSLGEGNVGDEQKE